jgi:hypothetical protein
LQRNLLLSLADADLYSAKWSRHIRDEAGCVRYRDADTKAGALAAIKRMRERLARPEYDAPALVALLEKRGLPQTAAHLRDVVALF